MIDAYTIGIRLALTDDLSRPLATIQRTLAALDGAISRSGTRVRALGQLGADIAPPDVSRAARWQGRPGDARSRRAAPFPAMRPVGSGQPEAVGLHPIGHPGANIHATGVPDWAAMGRLLLGRLSDDPNAHPEPPQSHRMALRRYGEAPNIPPTAAKHRREASPDVTDPPAARPRPQSDAPAGWGGWLAAGRALKAAGTDNGGSPGQLPTAALPTRGKTPDVAVFARNLLAAMSPAAGPGGINPYRHDTARGNAQIARLSPGVWDSASRSERILSALGRGGRGASFAEAEAADRHRRTTLPSNAPRRAAAPTQPAARDHMMQPPLSQRGDFIRAGRTDTTRSIAPDPTGTSVGELVLDGARFGRLICDRLVRHIDHPHSGLTGADPRLTPTWPGAAWG